MDNNLNVEQSTLSLRDKVVNAINNIDIALICIMALTAILYFHNLGDLPFAPDEATYTSQSAILAGHDEYRENFIPYSRSATNFQIHQFFTSLFLREYGVNEYAARLPTALMGVLSVFLVYIIARQLFNRRMALLSSLFIGINGYSLHFNRQINLDTSLVFFMILSIMFIVEWRKTRKDWYFYLFLISIILSTMSKVIIIVPLAIVVFAYLYVEKDHYAGLKMLLKPISILIIFGSIYYVYSFITGIVGIDDFVKTLTYASERETVGTPSFYVKTVFLLLGYAFPIVTMVGLMVSLKKRTEGDALILIWFATILLFFTYYPLQGYNYIFPIIPPLCLLCGRAIDEIADHIKKSTIVAIIVPLMIILSIYPTFNVLNNPDEVVYSIAPVRFDSLKYTILQDAATWLKDNAKSSGGNTNDGNANGGGRDINVAIYTFADSHVFSYYSGLKIYSISNSPGFYIPSDDGVNGGYAKIKWETTDVYKMIENGKIDYIVYMDEPRVMKNMTKFYDNDGMGFNAVYRKVYKTPSWYKKSLFNITIFEVQKPVSPKMESIDKSHFSVVVIPDPQEYSRGRPDIFINQTRWIKENVDTLNIKFVLQVGDLVDSGKSATQWNVANRSMSILDGSVPYLVTIGDHDYDSGYTFSPAMRLTTMYNTYFGYEKFAKYDWFGGHFPESGSENMYGFFSSGVGSVDSGDSGNNKDYMAISLEYCPTDETIAWADNVISENSDKKVIVFTHLYLNNKGMRTTALSVDSCSSSGVAGNEGEDIWNKLISRHNNVVLVVSGDQFGFGVRTDYVGDAPVNQVMENFQSVMNGGNGYLSIYTFMPEQNKIELRTYSPFLNKYDTAPEHMFDFTYKS